MSIKISRSRLIICLLSLFLLISATSILIIIPSVRADNNSQTELILQTPTDNILRLAITTNDIVYNSLDQKIYVSRPSSVGIEGNSITRINPLTGEVGSPVYVGSEPNKLALSDNGQTLYVTLDGAFGIRRYETLTQTPGVQFSIGRGQSVNANDAAYLASDIAVAPGNPDILAVSRYLPGISPPGVGVAVYNNGVRLLNTAPGHSASSNYIAFSSSASTLYGGGYDGGLRTMTVDGSGVTDTTGNGTPYYVKKLKFENNLVFDSLGHVIKPDTRELLGTCAGISTNAFVPDTATGRVLYAVKDSSGPNVTIKACDINTFAQIGSLTIPNVGYDVILNSLIRYGTNGLALQTSNNQIYLIQTALLPTNNPLPVPNGTPAATPTPTPIVYSKFIRQVSMPNKDMIYRSSEQKFYVSVPSSAGTQYGNTLTAVNPTTGTIESSVNVGNGPNRLAISDDDQIMYIGIDGSNAVKKFDLPTQTTLSQFPLGTGVNGPKTAYDIDVLPGNPNAVVVSYGSSSYSYDGADLYENGVKRGQKANSAGQINIVSPNTAYIGENYIYKYAIGPNGLTLQGNFTTGTSADSFPVGNLLYAGDKVLDLNTFGYVGTFSGAGYRPGIAVDVPHNRIFFLTQTDVTSNDWSILAYRLDNFLLIGKITLPGVLIYPSYPESPHRLIRWGENGLAFNDYNDKIYFLQTDLVSAAGVVPTAVQLEAQTYSGNEGSGNLPVTVVRSGGSTGTATVNYATQDGTATAGTDYTATAGTLVFAPGETSKIINIPIINDTVFEGNETFNFVLSNPNGGSVEVQSPNTAALTIVDNDSYPFLQTSDISVNEPPITGTATALITVQLSNQTTQTATVNYTTSNGTAIAGSDYIATSGTLTFAPLETTKTISVQILADENYNEPNEFFRINFSNAVNVSVFSSQTVTIVNYNPQTVRRIKFDFDGDGRADISVFRPGSGSWYIQQSSAGFYGTAFGFGTDKIVPADYDGDGKTDVAVYRNGTWYLQRSSFGFSGVVFGTADDIPVPADYDGDGKADVAVFRPSNGTWYIQGSTAGFYGTAFGQNGDKPVAADYDGDGKADIAVNRNGNWYINRSTLGFLGIQFGDGNDKLVPADYDGDGKTDVAVFRPSNGVWYLQQSTAGFAGIAFGLGTDIPVAADYDGDGKADVAVFRNGNWYLQRSTQGFTGITFGAASDLAVPNSYVR